MSVDCYDLVPESQDCEAVGLNSSLTLSAFTCMTPVPQISR